MDSSQAYTLRKTARTVKVTKFPLFKNSNKSALFWHRLTATTARPFCPPRNAQSQPFKTSLYFFYPYYVLQPAIQFHLLNTFCLNTRASAIPPLWKILKVSRSESEKNYSNATSIYILYNTY